MKNKELYNRTIEILVKAYLQGTLELGNDCACAVGNLIAANKGYTFGLKPDAHELSSKFKWNEAKPSWFWAINDGQVVNPSKKSNEEIKSTGYNWNEIILIEQSFERAEYNPNRDTQMFNGLMAVVEALDIIHENTDKELTTTVKAKFQKC